ncbi:MAG: N-6 DNA methylase [Planctomycetes bacterium]|jgi:adenine-specific DNA-methyltransferase|nr:N-6 DNA methylase [Planctomycetota bacterium]
MIATREHDRLRIQTALDAAKTQLERNKLGQFATPSALASQIIDLTRQLLPTGQIRFLDPAFGTGAFYSALLAAVGQSRISRAVGYEIDPHYGKMASRIWKDTPLELNIRDFTRAQFPACETEKANLVVCNPPYVRHHHIDSDEKLRLAQRVLTAAGVDLSGLAGLYCHFLCISHAWLAANGLAVWLIPSEFMDVNYGRQVKEYLLNRVTLLRIHRFDPEVTQFDDALVSSAVVFFRNAPPQPGGSTTLTFGASLLEPAITMEASLETLRNSDKWTGIVFASDVSVAKAHVSDFFTITRGIATGSNAFFMIPRVKARALGLPEQFLRPILPSPRYVKTCRIETDHDGYPMLPEQLCLLDCSLPEDQVKSQHPALWRYLKQGVEAGIDKGYLCARRNPWYAQEQRLPAAFLCTYMGRKGKSTDAFRFVLNKSQALAANVYLLLYPKPRVAEALRLKPELLDDIWQALNRISPVSLKRVGRVYGGGLHKLEPKELANAPADEIGELLGIDKPCQQASLF